MTFVLWLKHWIGVDPILECEPEHPSKERYRAKAEGDFGRVLNQLTEETKVRSKESDTLKRLRERAVLAREQWGSNERIYPK